MKRSRNYRDVLIESLKDSEEAIAYLNAALEEYLKGDEESKKVFLSALKNVADAQGGVSQLAERAGLGRESLYKTLSARGNPKLSTLATLVHAMGLDLRFCSASK
jgi:probable addiction module antidote protein